jgi:hypothetical protein
LAGHVARMGQKMHACSVLVRKPEGKRPLKWPRHRREDIKMDRREIWCGGMVWIHLAQDVNRWRPVVNTVMNLWVP